MPHPARLVATVVLLALAGCSTVPRTPTTKEVPPDVDLRTPSQITPPPPPSRPIVPVTPPTNPPVVPTPAPRPKVTLAVPTGTWINLARWADSNRVGAWTNLHSSVTPTFALQTSSGTFVVRAGSLIAQWSGLELRLGYAPQMIGGELYLHTLDLQKNLIPLLTTPPEFTPGARVIVLDPGHGGTDSGTRSFLPGKFEKDYTLDWAKRLKPLLETNGWTVYLTRTNDVEVSLAARVEFADARKADLFLSLHFNATTSSEHSGIETYSTTPTGMPSTVTRDYEDNVVMNFPNNHFDVQNQQLAMRLHRAILAATGEQDRGVRHARFLSVLRAQNRPAVLIEGGYLSNPAGAKLVNTPEHRQKLAEAVAKALP